MIDHAVFDIETDGLLDTITKVHCVSIYEVKDGQGRLYSLTDYSDIKNFFTNYEGVLFGHNIKRFDIPAIKMILGVDILATCIDTLFLSWYLYPERPDHNLENWGNSLDIEKPKIADWNNLTVEEYVFRCESDVKINTKMLNLMMPYLITLYGDFDRAMRFMQYLMFKADCAREQEEEKWLCDIKRCKAGVEFLEKEKVRKAELLSSVMPPNIKYKENTRPAKMEKVDGTLTEKGKKWLELLEKEGLPPYHVGTVKTIKSVEPGNPGSTDQLKSWLFSLGWVPETYKYVKDSYDENGRAILRKIPQVNLDEGRGICDSVKKLYGACPGLENLEGYSVIGHRLGLLKGFLRDVDSGGYLKAEIKGLTNTLRFQHTVIVNLPKASKPYGDIVRGCLIAPPGYKLCGSDMASLEDSTKRHFMYFYDPKYVEEMMAPGYDPHLDISLQAGLVTADDIEFYKMIEAKKEAKEEITSEEKARHTQIKSQRNDRGKKVNFGAVYGAGAAKLALTGNMPITLAKTLHRAYWNRNKAVKQVAEDCIVKTVNEQMWLFNPVSQFWYSLRDMKDRFSTLNQGTGVYCFDTQVRHVRQFGIRLCGQFHDEFIFKLPEGTEEVYSQYLDRAIEKTNEVLQLNVPLRISKDFGYNYAEIH